ncbi:hypothetical protein C8J56DRAFT_1132067 [Mycena floridula]|nr:hypothetical protein C8J56DRAFT_1132067 [Mycena floridula]
MARCDTKPVAVSQRLPRMGVLNASPLKKRNVKKTRQIAMSSTRALRMRQLDDSLAALTSRAIAALQAQEYEEEDSDVDSMDSDEDIAMVDDSGDEDYREGDVTMEPTPAVTSSQEADLLPCQPPAHSEESSASQKPLRRTEPSDDSIKTYDEWHQLLPKLVPAFLAFHNTYIGEPIPSGRTNLKHLCMSGCPQKISTVKCLYLDSVFVHKVNYCLCQDLCYVLVNNGLFPATPTHPRTAFSMVFLDLYRALFERSCDAINAMSSAMQTFYERRGFPSVHNDGALKKDPLRKQLSSAVQWHDCLRVSAEALADRAIAECAAFLDESSPEIPAPVTVEATLEDAAFRGPGSPEIPAPADSTTGSLSAGECDQFLQDACPACFGGRLWGRSFQQGGDVHVSTDRNFHHKHYKSAGDTPPFCQPKHILPKAYVDDIKEHVFAARCHKKSRKPKLPDEAVDACEESHQAAKPEPTIVVLYDLACVLDRSRELYELFPSDLNDRLQFATTAMHAYAHQWSCQLVFNPRMRVGLALTDGEGVERIWSALRQLISITRYSSRSRRLWLLDRLLQSTAANHLDTLGDWITSKWMKVNEQIQLQETLIRISGESQEEIRFQWEDQKKEQTSIQAHLPNKLKKDLEQVLLLQGEIITTEQTIQSVRATLKTGCNKSVPLDHLRKLEEDHIAMKTRADELYASLNVGEVYPELKGIELAFVQTLLLARDLKISLRRRVIGTFFEMDRLDQAVGGAHQALGTKAHQLSKKSIGKRAPALANDITKFNDYSEALAKRSQANPNCRIPIPAALPTTIKELRECQDLNEDVWISKSPGKEVPRWLAEPELRKIIQSCLRLDRCIEERRRLGREADNLCRWFGRKFAALELAIHCDKFRDVHPYLRQRRDHLLSLRLRWATNIVPVIHFDTRIASAISRVRRIAGDFVPVPLTWLTPASSIPVDEDDWQELSDTEADVAVQSSSVPLSDILEALEMGDPPEEAVSGPTPPNSSTAADRSSFQRVSARANVSSSPASALRQALSPTRIPAACMVNLPHMPYLMESLTIADSHNLLREDLLAAFEAFSSSFFPGDPRRQQQRKFYGQQRKGLVNSMISYEDIQRFKHRQWLNDDCISVTSSVLFDHVFPDHCSPHIALLSCYVTSQTRTEGVWRTAKHSLYWSRSIWLLPVNRVDESHWVLYIVYVNSGIIRMFDSFGHPPKEDEVQRIVNLVRFLIDSANRNGHSLTVPVQSWRVQSLVNPTNPLQRNSVDCGVWVIAAIFAVLRGKETVGGISEGDMDVVRECILQGVLNLSSV